MMLTIMAYFRHFLWNISLPQECGVKKKMNPFDAESRKGCPCSFSLFSGRIWVINFVYGRYFFRTKSFLRVWNFLLFFSHTHTRIELLLMLYWRSKGNYSEWCKWLFRNVHSILIYVCHISLEIFYHEMQYVNFIKHGWNFSLDG